MGEIIRLSEIQAARQRSQRHARDRESLEHAVALMRESLARTAAQLRDAPLGEQVQLLERVERLTAMVRYGLRMLGENVESGSPDPIVRPNS